MWTRPLRQAREPLRRWRPRHGPEALSFLDGAFAGALLRNPDLVALERRIERRFSFWTIRRRVSFWTIRRRRGSRIEF